MNRWVRLALFVGMAAVAATPLTAQTWAKDKLQRSPRHREIVTLHNGSRTLQAFVAYPAASDKRPVVLVIHEIFGLSDWAQEVTDELAAAGYVAIAPDLLSGEGPNGGGSDSFTGQTEVARAINKLPPEQITGDLNAAADWALKQPASNGQLYVVGFCWGGTQSFRYVTNRHDLKAAFVFYGMPPANDAMAQITARVYGFYPGQDARTSATVAPTEAEMKKLGKLYHAVIYPGADHGFMRSGEQPGATSPNVKARDAAWAVIKRVIPAR